MRISLLLSFPLYIGVLEDDAFVILGSQLSFKLFLSLPGPQHMS